MYKRGDCVSKEKCSKCKKQFDISELTLARNEKGEYPKTSKKLYCRACEEQEYQRKVLIDYLHRLFIQNKYYNDVSIDKSLANKKEYQRLMRIIASQIKSLNDDGFSYQQIRLIIQYMLTKESIEFSDTMLGLVPYYYSKTSKYYNELYRISNSKTFGSIPAPKEDRITRPAHKPNKRAVQKISIEMV